MQFLPFINNEVAGSVNATYKANFVRLKQAHFFGSPVDQEILPWQSALFGFWDADGKTMVNMTATANYQNDTFGLRTLHESGRLHLHVVDDVCHTCWVHDEAVVAKYVLPLLT